MTSSTGGNFNIRLYDMFRQRFNFGETDAREMAIEMKEVIKEENAVMQDQTLNIVLKEFEKVHKEFEKVHKDFEYIRNDISSFKGRVDDRFTFLEKTMASKADVAEARAEILKWSFIFWIGQATVLGGILLLIFKNI